MRKLLIALLLCISASLPAQYASIVAAGLGIPLENQGFEGPVVKRMFTIDAYGNQLAGVLTVPPDYSTNPDSCAVLIFFHGVGEAGDGTLGTVEKIYANGSPVGLAAAGNTMTFTDPISGKPVRFITLGLQGRNGWCAYSVQGNYVLENDILKNYRISRRRVYITGLSAGGEVTWEAITNPALAGLYATAVPMSTPAPAIGSISTVAANGIRVWAFHGNLDGPPTGYDNSVRLVGQVNAIKPGLARLTTNVGIGHGGWSVNYDPATREPITYWYNGVKYTKSLNQYEFDLLCSKGNNVLFDTTAANVQPAGTVTKSVPVVSFAGTTATLDGSASTGNGSINGWDWYCSDSTGKYYKLNIPAAPGLPYGSGQPGTLTATGFAKGKYNFRLNVQDKYGYTASTTVSSSVGTVTPTPIPDPPPAPVVTKTIMGRLYLSGKEFVIYQDSAGVWSVDIN